MRPYAIALVILGLGAIVTCANPAPKPDKPRVEPMAGGGDTDVVRLKSGETIQGRILRMDESTVAIRTDKNVRVFSRKDVLETSFAIDAKGKNEVRLNGRKEESATMPLPPSSWFPRTSSKEPMKSFEVDFFDPHPWKGKGSCVGQLAPVLQEIPELALFAQPGGKIVFHDPMKRGWHSHTFPGEALQHPVGQPGLTIEMSTKGLPQAIAFVSAGQETSSIENPQRKSYGIPDAVYAEIKDLSAADTVLAAQPFAGGAPKETAVGTCWAFSLPRNDRQCWVYLLDRHGKHGKILDAAFATYGDALLAPDCMIDMMSADGTLVGRILLLPIPPSVSADGPAPEPIKILAGKDAALVATVAVPPRHSIIVPPKAPSTKADIYVNFYDVSKSVSQKIVTAWGTGYPDADVVVSKRDLAQETADEHLKLDVSGYPEERFPVVAWVFCRRTYVWRSGGYLAPTELAGVPALRGNKAPSKVISHQDSVAHVLPILFVGPKPGPQGSPGRGDEGVAGGLSNAFLADALRREAGLPDYLNAMNTLSNLAPRDGGGGKSGGDSATSVTNIYITIPPHASGGLPDLTTGAWSGNARSLEWYPENYGSGSVTNPFGGNRPGVLGNYDILDQRSGTRYDRAGNMIYDPQTGTTSATPSGSSSQQDFGLDVFSRSPVYNFQRRNRP